MEPLLDRRFIFDTYASRRGKGVHAAVARYRFWAQRYPYVLKLDVRRYFDSIDHQRLKAKLARHIADADGRWLFHQIIDHGPRPPSPRPLVAGEDLVDLMERPCGLPLGNLTSQFLGNLYLDDLDHFIKEALGVPAYLRYVDDLTLLGDDKPQLWRWCEAIEGFLAGERPIHARKRWVVPVRCGIDLLGYRVYPRYVRLSRGSGYRFRRRFRSVVASYAAGRLSLAEVKTHVAGWLGHARQADTQGLRRAVLSSVSF